MRSNFDFLAHYWPDMAEIGALAEAYLYADPNACIFKLGLLAERIVNQIIHFERMSAPAEMTFADRIRMLRREDLLPKNIDDILFAIRKARNDAVHTGISDFTSAQTLLRMAYNLSAWFMEVYGDWSFTAPEFIMPENISADEDFEERLQEKEKCISELLEQINEIKTAASDMAPEERTKKAETASASMELSDAESQYLIREQIRLECSVISVVNYVLHQNQIPVVQSVTIVNNSDNPLENVEIRIHSAPELCLRYVKHIDYVPANSTFEAKNIDIILNAEYLASLTEKIRGLIYISLVSEENVLFSEVAEITALAFDEWHGYAYYPELLASFVTPNHPEIIKINAEASKLLEKWTGNPSLDGYQSRSPQRVLAQAAAVYGALQKQNIVYSMPPASFGQVGQRVRLCDAVMQQKMGTCLDLTLFYAACLEAIGLHPLLILKAGHAFAGVWLEELSFPETVQDDASLITKRLASGVNEIAVVETTLFVAGQHYSFDEARAAAEQHLVGENPVEYIIDVARARLSGISPLPMRIHTETGWHIERETLRDSELTAAPKQFTGRISIDTSRPEEVSKKTLWERKLLDLSLRNMLINMRLTKNIIPLYTSSLDELEDALADGSDFAIYPRPSEWQISSEPNFENMHSLAGRESVIKHEFKNKRLRAALTEGELTKRLKDLYRAYKASLEENGANSLFLALGLLRWYEGNASLKPRYAPLILIPINMVRKSAAQGYVIRLSDDEPQMNITLLEMLKQDFGITIQGLDPLPSDEHGVDIRKSLTIIREAIKNLKRWDVLESAYLGTFSFSQFVMWNDLRNRSEDLARNKIVYSLIDGKLAWDACDMEISPRVTEDNVFLPLPADASQLFAISEACKGKSFILHGPPGTGKSQTITAMIANALAQGKTVLFVAEKMAALEVVKKRLEKLGIAPFCLELHSNKAKKKDVLEQLKSATEVTKTITAEAYARKASQIAALRQDLDSYAKALHAPQKCGMSLFSLIDSYEKYSHASDLPDFPFEFAHTVTSELLDQHETVLERLVASGREVGHPCGHPLRNVGCTQYSQQLRVVLPGLLSEYEKALDKFMDASSRFESAIEETNCSDFDSILRLVSIARELVSWANIPRAWAQAANIDRYLSEVRIMAQHYIKAHSLFAQLSMNWTSDFFKLEGSKLLAEYNEASSKWFLGKILALNGLIKRLAGYSKTLIDKNTLGQQLSMFAEYQAEKAAADALFSSYGDDLHNLYEGEETNWQKIIELTTIAKESAEKLRIISGSDRIRIQYAGVEACQKQIPTLLAAWDSLITAKNALYSLLSIRDHMGGNWGNAQKKLCQDIRAHIGILKEWINWNRIAEEAAALGLQPVLTAYQNGMAHEEVQPAYKKAIYKLLASAAIDADSALNHFSGAMFIEKIEQLKRLDAELMRLTQQEIFCRLASRVPNFSQEAAQSSELGILQRAIRSGGRGVSIRRLFEQIPNLLPRLCPCLLMSPLSVAQYLDPNCKPFDIVIFDEASQLPTCKAVGALARGKDAIIVGDPNQMPPTSFFASNIVDEEHLETEDLENILEDCLALNMPQTHLLWHYRSHHESLIAFSNSQFYENRLYTFPSVNDRISKVSLVHVNGVFERGRSRQNRAEAEAVVNELIRRSRDKELSKLSVGVVTFNISQQNLIDDLLAEACKTDAQLEQWAFETKEPLFIKNLENVQGDERDVILFSIGYGPDESGRVTMHFGPLNREGGWRRLNVAVSRAREEMIVFSSLTPDQINVSRTSAKGVAALKAFLEYAASGKLVQDENTSRRCRIQQSGIAESICRALKEHGYDTQQNVGRSEYRIDVGVVDPANPQQYMLGILLDGPVYGEAKTTRDRELNRISVLEDLGWKIHRVWSLDWWDNCDKEIKRILAKLEEIQNRVKQETAKDETENSVEPVPVIHRTVAGIVKLEDTQVWKDSAMQAKLELDDIKCPATDNEGITLTAINASSKHFPPVYKSYKHESQYFINPEDFALPSMTKIIQSRIEAVLAEEAPISKALLTRRVLQSFGIARAGSRIQARMDDIYRRMRLKKTVQDEAVVFWNREQDPNSYAGCRYSSSEIRDIRDVPVQEIANAIYAVLHEQISMGPDDLVREAAKKIGYTRMGSNVVASLESAIQYAKKLKCITLTSYGTYILTDEGTERAEAVLRLWKETMNS